MILDWQTWCALAMVVLACTVLMRRFLGLLNGKSKGGCGSCPNKSAPPLMKTLPLVQIGKVKSTKSTPDH